LFEGALVGILKLRIFWALAASNKFWTLERLMQVDLSIIFAYHSSRYNSSGTWKVIGL